MKSQSLPRRVALHPQPLAAWDGDAIPGALAAALVPRGQKSDAKDGGMEIQSGCVLDDFLSLTS